ncbi:MAG: hypothetical protein ACRD1A_02695 [Terriglobales bacterium]
MMGRSIYVALGVAILSAFACAQTCPSGYRLSIGSIRAVAGQRIEFFDCLGKHQHGIVGVGVGAAGVNEPAVWLSRDGAMMYHPLKGLNTVLASRDGTLIVVGAQYGGKAANLNLLLYQGGELVAVARNSGVGFAKLRLTDRQHQSRLVFESLPDDLAWGVPGVLVVTDRGLVESDRQFPDFFRSYAKSLESRAGRRSRNGAEAIEFGERAAARQCTGALTATRLGGDEQVGLAFCVRALSRVRNDPSLDAATKAAIVAKIQATLRGARSPSQGHG